MDGRDRLADYQLASVLAELEHTRSHGELAAMPDIARLLSSRAFRRAALKIQELVWTLRRLATTKSDRASPPRTTDSPPNRTGLYLDVTALHRGSTKGGIRRLSLQLAEHAIATGLATPTYVEDERLWPFDPTKSGPIEFAPGDVFVIVSFFWEPFEEYGRVIARAKAAGARTAIFVHDVIPAIYPGLMLRFHDRFRTVLQQLTDKVDMIVTLSRSSADAIHAYLLATGTSCSSLPIRWFHMGSDATRVPGEPAGGAAIRGLDVFSRKTLLSVGTLAPHKGAPVALSAFERCWAEGLDANYLVVGQADASWTSIPARITGHPQYGRRLFWFDDLSDAELADAYRRCHCYIQPSIDEGFGIPLIEAASYDKAIIASDIPVFREIGSDDILYFARCDADDLAAKITYACAHPVAPARVTSLDWRASFLQLVAILQELAARDAREEARPPTS